MNTDNHDHTKQTRGQGKQPQERRTNRIDKFPTQQRLHVSFALNNNTNIYNNLSF